MNKTPYFNVFELKKQCFTELDLHVWARFYLKDFLIRANAKFAPTKHGEDHLFANAVVLNAKKINYINETFYTYRCRSGSAANVLSSCNLDVFQNIKLFSDYLKENNFYQEFKDEFENYKTRIIVLHYGTVPPEFIEEYESMAHSILTEKQYKKMKKDAQGKLKIGEWIFSIKNKKQNAVKSKLITILGISFEIKPKKKKVEEC